MKAPLDRKPLIERLFSERRTALQSFFRRRIRQPSDASDLTQEVYLRMLRVKDGDSIQNPEGYLFTVAANLVREYGIANRRRAATVDELRHQTGTLFEEIRSADEDVDMAHRMRSLEQSLTTLSPRCRAVVLWRYRDHMPIDEIAERIGVSRSMVKKYLAQGLAACRKQMMGTP